jgi:DNA-binding NarL/FixJ family response regulator
VEKNAVTTRERETLALLSRGLKFKEIASEMGITLRTVVAHVESVKKKLGARNAVHLISLAYKEGLLNGSLTYQQPPTRAK